MWLEVEVCYKYEQMSCPRSHEQCHFAHPDQDLLVKNGRVTCCFNYIRDRCLREKCRYFHPPIHIKDRLVMAGKHFGMKPKSPLSPVYAYQVPMPLLLSDRLYMYVCPNALSGQCNEYICGLVHPGMCVVMCVYSGVGAAWPLHFFK